MDLPVWVTVVIARFVGGFFAGFITASLIVSQTGGGMMSQSSYRDMQLIVLGIGSVAVAVALVLLLPALSGVRVSGGTALIAAVVGEAIPFVASLLLVHAAVSSGERGAYLPMYGVGSPLISLGATVLGVMATAWIIQSSTGSGGHSPRYDLYGKASRQSLDDEY